MSHETSLEHRSDPEVQELQTSTPEQSAPPKTVVFEDERGIERQPHPSAPEIYASAEIQQSVSDHFMAVDRGLEEIASKLAALEDDGMLSEQGSPFQPLTDTLLKGVLKAALEQLPSLTQTVVSNVERQERSGRLFKRTRTTVVPVEKTIPVEGYTSAKMWDKEATWKHAIRNPLGTHKVDPEYMSSYERTIQELLLQVLTSTESGYDEKQVMKQRGTSTTKLPLLATKLRDAGLSAEQISKLTWQDIERLVPEAEYLFADIQKATQTQALISRYISLRELASAVKLLSPNACDTVARIYYDEGLLARLQQTLSATHQAMSNITPTLFPDWASHDQMPSGYLDEQRQSMAEFFDRAMPADTLLIHGSRYAPRIIRSKFLKPAASMDDTEFTFTTNRTNMKGYGASDIDGSRGLHWASANSGTNYATDMSQRALETAVSSELAERYRGASSLVEAELSKGGLGMGRFAMRLGDVIAYTPYGGRPETSHSTLRNTEVKPKPRYGVVELTPKGWQQVAAKLNMTPTIYDTAYVAAPEHHELKTLYDFAYPIDHMIIGIPSLDPDTIPAALRESGWDDERIRLQTYSFTQTSFNENGLQEAVNEHPAYPHSVVVAIRKDL